MRKLLTLFLFTFAIYANEPVQPPAEEPLVEAPPSDFQKMFDSNDSYSASVRTFNTEQFGSDQTVGASVDPTLRIKIAPNVFFKTMAIVNINSDAAVTGMLGVEKILFGLEIRFEGF